MKIADNNSLAVPEQVSEDETIGSITSLDEMNLQNLPFEEFLIRPNNDAANQTLIDDANGDSRGFEAQPDQLLSRQYLVHEQLAAFQKWDEATHEQFRTLQKWEGYVIDVGPDTFRAKLVPVVGEGPDMEAEIYLEEIDEESRTLLAPGAVFYWSIGYRDRPSGRRRESIIRFQRLKTWTKRELDSIDTDVAKLKSLINAE